MREMKDSGIDWIGEIPKDWMIAPLGKLSVIKTGNTPSKNIEDNYNADGLLWAKPDNLNFDNAIIDTKEKLSPKGAEVARVVAPFTTLVCCIGTIGKLGYSSEYCAFNQQINSVTFNTSVDNKYGYYHLCASEEQHKFYSNGNVVKILNCENQKKIKFSIPSVREQTKIANFLDSKCGEVDKLVSLEKSLIEQLKSYKQSLITEVVTGKVRIESGKVSRKPFDTKPSGIDWIGEIPADWKMCRLRDIGSCQNGISKGGECFGKGDPFVSYGDVYKSYVLPSSVEHLVQSTLSDQINFSVMYGDVFFSRTSETIEEIAFSSVCKKTIPKATFSGFIIRVRLNQEQINVDFSKYYFRNIDNRNYFSKEMNIMTRASLSQNLLKNLQVLIPTMDEQIEIANYLDKKCESIDKLIEIKQQKISSILGYKKSIIYEYVTGKKEVV